MYNAIRLSIAVFSCLLLSETSAQQQTLPSNTATSLTSNEGRFVVSYNPMPDRVVINRIHNWVIRVEAPAGEPVNDAELSLLGGMPVHDHGLPTLPQMTRNMGDGTYLVEGMKFHMNGWWQVTVTVVRGDLRDDVTFDLVL